MTSWHDHNFVDWAIKPQLKNKQTWWMFADFVLLSEIRYLRTIYTFSLKQKFPKAFQDLCFFSEVSSLLGSCSFRLKARRFIQELFEDMDTSKVHHNLSRPQWLSWIYIRLVIRLLVGFLLGPATFSCGDIFCSQFLVKKCAQVLANNLED